MAQATDEEDVDGKGKPKKSIAAAIKKLPKPKAGVRDDRLLKARGVVAKIFTDEGDPTIDLDPNQLTKSLPHLPTGIL